MGKFSSLLLGAVTGAAAAYFLTSKKGKETTDKVRDFVKEYQENPDDIPVSYTHLNAADDTLQV